MQLASSGARALGGRQTAFGLGHNAHRNIHIPSSFPRPSAANRPTSTGTAQALFRQTRNLISRFASILTAPAKYATPANIPGAMRGWSHVATRGPSIKDRLSLPARYALGRPLSAPCLPRPPAVPRSTMQVGLGTARNFSTARPIFQNIVDNVPVTARALWEADWQIRMEEEKKRLVPKKQRSEQSKKQKSKLVFHDVPKPLASVEETQAEELDRYFPLPAEPEVTTYLLIPLAPTPTSRLPLRASASATSTSHPLLPFSILSSVHQDHATHSLRVSTLFSRLDSSRVFDQPGVSTSAFGDPSGLATVLEVKFEGWTKDKVRGVLGESGTGWCVLEEVWKEEEATDQQVMDEALSEMSLEDAISFSAPSRMSVDIDPSSSFVLPTLDFSASFPPPASSGWSTPSSVGTATPISDIEYQYDWASRPSSIEDTLSDIDGASSAWEDSLPTPLSRTSSLGSDGWIGLGFSSQFAGRAVPAPDDWDEPRDSMF
ncbi:hypothetical protein K474DRAFT_39300 [Panus rudis PR-1116 ss-1]|nr:hypothetical protein K474DRAFT_39300 [Panus rudis PR-1116 ss-1]